MKTIIFLIGGAVAGVITGLFLAPDTGINTRNRAYYSLLDFFKPIEREKGNTYNITELSADGAEKLEEMREALSQNDK